MQVIKRKDAIEQGLRYYFTGKPCKHGHTCQRWAGCGGCTVCDANRKKENAESEYLRKKKWKQENKDKVSESARKYRNANRESLKEKGRIYSKNNRDKGRINEARYRKKNREKHNKRVRDYAKKNPEKTRLWNANRRARKIKATPPWADMVKIKEIYSKCPKGHEVDHIIPLVNPEVCGLHVETNLQYLTPPENRSKNNKYER